MKPIQKYIDLGMRFLTDRMPRRTAIAIVVLAGLFLSLAVLVPLLGGFHSDTVDANVRLKASIAKLTKGLQQAKDDHQFVLDHRGRFDALMHSDKLVPHTRGNATDYLQKVAVQRGMTTLSYSFGAVHNDPGSSRESVTGGYLVHAEDVELKLGAPLDTVIFDFLTDLTESFPGSVVIETLTLDRTPDFNTDALNNVSRGQEAGLLKGTAGLSWRTAQAVEPEKARKEEGPQKRRVARK
jgi:hypothetical protein